MQDCLASVGIPSAQAALVAEVLLTADLAGVDSHGCARLRRYVDGVAAGAIDPAATPSTVRRRPSTALIDAGNGLGQPAAVAAMRMAIEKASSTGVGVVSVRRSNHFGIAGYYASLAARVGMVGLAMTNASPQVAPTFGAEPMFGTNPIAVGMPTGAPSDFLLDMATSTVGRGKLEVRKRNGEPIPHGWVIDAEGLSRTDVAELIDGLKARRGYSLLPLGGGGEEHGGHKGYGLGLFVDLVCGPLAGASWGRHVYGAAGADLGHMLIAIDVGAFVELADFRRESGKMFEELREMKRLGSAAEVLIPGDKEASERRRRLAGGIPLTAEVRADLHDLGLRCGVALAVETPREDAAA